MQRKRFQFIKKLFELSEKDQTKFFDGDYIGEQLGFDENSTKSIGDCLDEEKPNKSLGGDSISITHDGIAEIEEVLSNPDKPTRHFLEFNIINLK